MTRAAAGAPPPEDGRSLWPSLTALMGLVATYGYVCLAGVVFVAASVPLPVQLLPFVLARGAPAALRRFSRDGSKPGRCREENR
jgi:hypothetical protein